MKESLKLLNVNTSGLEVQNRLYGTSDDEILSVAKRINDKNEKIAYLNKNASGIHINSKFYLAEILKKNDPEAAWTTIYSVLRFSPTSVKAFLLLAQIALEHLKYRVANSAIEVAVWLSDEKDLELRIEVRKIYEEIKDSLLNKKEDLETNKTFWSCASIDKFSILERIFYAADYKKMNALAFKMLEIYPFSDSFDAVYRAFNLRNDKKWFLDLIDFIENKSSLEGDFKQLYLGLCSFSIQDFKRSVSCLNNVSKENQRSSIVKLYLSLNHLYAGSYDDFVKEFNEIVSTSNIDKSFNTIYPALYFINMAIANLKMPLFEFPNQKNISCEISKIISDLMLKCNCSGFVNELLCKFQNLEYHVVLPLLNVYLAEAFIKLNKLEKAKELLSFVDDFEKHRLMSWIYRLEGNNELAETELVLYRKNFTFDKGSTSLVCQLINLDFPELFSKEPDEIMELVSNGYKQNAQILNDLEFEYGLNSMTCIETGCQDCCTKTFPSVSFVEYLFMLKWLEKQPVELKIAIESNSKEIVSLYIEKYNKEPKFLIGENVNFLAEYPLDFVFNCPALGDNKCNVYEARPFTCRSYGFTCRDGVKYKGCDFFYAQFGAVTKLNNVRKVINMDSFLNFANKADQILIGQKMLAPIPVWFAQSYERTIEKIKKQIESSNDT